MNDYYLQCPAIDSAYVDAYTTDEVWLAASQKQKDSAILDACYYFRANYRCIRVDYTDTLPSVIQDAMAELAVVDINGNLYTNKNNESLSSKSIKAGSASISKSYTYGFVESDPTLKKVRDMVSPYCTYTGGTTIHLSRA